MRKAKNTLTVVVLNHTQLEKYHCFPVINAIGTSLRAPPSSLVHLHGHKNVGLFGGRPHRHWLAHFKSSFQPRRLHQLRSYSDMDRLLLVGGGPVQFLT